MNYYIGIDIGTSATKAICYDTHGKMMVEKSISYELFQPHPGYAEENPADWANASIEVIREIEKLYSPIKGIGLSGQMHGLVILDKDDNILRNSIIWCDNRASKEKEEIEKIIGNDKVKQITGNDVMAPFTLAKLLWVKNNEPEIFSKISKVMLPKDYVRYVLTGEFKTEYSDASGMQMLDIKEKKFSKELLNPLGISTSILPTLCESDEITGYLKKDLFPNLTDVFVVGGAGDQAAAALGNGIVHKTDISLVLGSSGVVFKPIGLDELSSKLKTQVFMHAVKDTYHIMGVTNGCGLSYSWYLDNLCKDEKAKAKEMGTKGYDLVNEEAAKAPPGSNGLIYLPYLNGERTPHNDSFATGSFLGIRQTTTKADFSRSVLEGVSYSLRDCYSLFNKDNYNIYISGGGAKSSLWREILATNFKANILENNVTEAGTLGVALLAMMAGNEYKSLDEAISNIMKINRKTKPNKVNYKVYDNYYRLYKEGYKSLKKYYQFQKKVEEKL